jgi:hypothetical protein
MITSDNRNRLIQNKFIIFRNYKFILYQSISVLSREEFEQNNNNVIFKNHMALKKNKIRR